MITTAASALLFGAALRALIMASVLWAGLRLLRVRNVWVQKAAWSVVLLAGFAMPVLIASPWSPGWLAVRVPAFSWPQTLFARTHANSAKPLSQPTAQLPAPNPAPPAALEVRHPRSRVLRTEDSASLPGAADERAPIATSIAGPATVSPVSAASPVVSSAPKTQPFSVRPLQAAWLLYLAVSVALLFRLLFGVAAAIRLWLRAESVNASVECGFNPQIPVRASHLISSPVNIGSGIILPADYAEWDAETLRVVLAHEGAHVEQRDFYLQLAAGVYAAINWFSPLGWWLKRKLSELSEAISDRAGLEESASGPAYAQLLLEFAARPRPTLIGVPMAHKGNLSERIDGLLNDAHFKQAFGGTRRALIGAVVVPLILVAMTATVRVKAAATSPAGMSQDQPAPPPAAVAQTTGQATPAPPQVTDSSDSQAPPAPVPPDAAPSPAAVPNPSPAPAPPLPPDGAQAVPPVPPMPPVDVQVPRVDVRGPNVEVHVPPIHIHGDFNYDFKGDWGGFSGEPIAIVGDPGTEPRFFGWWNSDRRDSTRDEEIDKIRKVAHGHFILFRRDDKTYYIDDPATVGQFETMEKQLDELGGKMKDLGNQMKAVSQEHRDDWAKLRESNENIPTPDLTKEMADLGRAVADLKLHQGGTVTREQLAQIQRAVGELQRQVMSAEFKVKVNLDMSAMNAFSDQQRALGQQMGQLGGQMGRLAHENVDKMNDLIDQSLKNGQAKPAN